MQETILKQLNWRYAVKKFDPRRLPREDVSFLLECLRLSPSSFGLQPWRFVHVENPGLRKQLLEVSFGQEKVASASDLLVLARFSALTEADVDRYAEALASEHGTGLEKNSGYIDKIKTFVAEGTVKGLDRWVSNQVYIALGTLLAAAAMAGIDACPMGGFENEAYDQILGLENLGLKSEVIVTLGYRASDDKYASLKKVRYPIDELVLTLS